MVISGIHVTADWLRSSLTFCIFGCCVLVQMCRGVAFLVQIRKNLLLLVEQLVPSKDGTDCFTAWLRTTTPWKLCYAQSFAQREAMRLFRERDGKIYLLRWNTTNAHKRIKKGARRPKTLQIFKTTKIIKTYKNLTLVWRNIHRPSTPWLPELFTGGQHNPNNTSCSRP